MRATKLITLFFPTRESDNNIRSETPLTCSSRRNSTYRNPSHTNSDACGRKRGRARSRDRGSIERAAATAAYQGTCNASSSINYSRHSRQRGSPGFRCSSSALIASKSGDADNIQ